MAAIAGVDGCKGGWVAVARIGGGAPGVFVHATFVALLGHLPGDAVIAVDMPIGLPDRITGGGRGPEQAVRRLLGRRRSSVFSMPSRAAVHAEPGPFTDWEAMRAARKRADAVARRTSDPSRGLTFQAFALFAKIREIDVLLRDDPALSERVIESHPEAAFAVLNGGQAMAEPKKTRGRVNPGGMAERKALLAACGIEPAVLERKPPPGADVDDVLDACVLLLVAGRHLRGETVAHPDPPPRDRFGLPVAIRT